MCQMENSETPKTDLKLKIACTKNLKSVQQK